MTTTPSHQQDLAALLLGGGGGGRGTAAAADAGEKQSRIVSASCSVVSSSSSSGGEAAMNSLREQLSASSAAAAAAAGGAVPSSAPHGLVEQKEGEGGGELPSKTSSSTALPPAPPSALPGGSNGPSSTSNATMVMQMGAPPHPVAEFLFQLTKMLTDDNSAYIQWRNASIFVHDPPGLEKDILPKYFRHSNYSSFQRQMNYFGFRKIAGKGKMAPCSYVNEAAKEDLSSLLFIKRKKTGVSSAAAKLMAQQNRLHRSMGVAQASVGMGGANQLMASSMMGASALNPALGNASLSLNNFSLMGGLPGIGAGAPATQATNNLVSAGTQAALNEASLLREQQQNVLAQLQQAHASALNNSTMSAMGGVGVAGGINQAQVKQNVGGLCIGNAASNAATLLGNDQANLGRLLTNDQGNIYANGNDVSAWGNSTDASLLIQQAAGNLASGNFAQGIAQGMSGGGGSDANNFARIDSAANLRALINQQISMFNTSAPGDAFSSSMNALAGAPVQAAQAQGPSSQQSPGLGSLSAAAAAGNASQGLPQSLPFEWNEMLQRMGGGAGVDNPGAATASIRQLEQQLLQGGGLQGGGNVSVPGPAATGQQFNGQHFNLNGLFGSAGTGGSQTFSC